MKKEIKEGFKITLENETFKLDSSSIYPESNLFFNLKTKETRGWQLDLDLDNKQLSDMISILSELKEEIDRRQIQTPLLPKLEEEKKTVSKFKLFPKYCSTTQAEERLFDPTEIISVSYTHLTLPTILLV